MSEELTPYRAELKTVPATPMQMVDPERLIMTAIEKNVPVETLEKLLAMRDKLVAEQSRNAYYADLAAFQRACPVIIKTKEVLNKDGRTVRYRYAPLDSIVQQIGGLLADHGFSYWFDTSTDSNTIKVTCHAAHRFGHTESIPFESHIDPQAFMNLAQKFGSALTFGKRYAFLALFGIMTGDDDDDAQITTPNRDAQTAKEKLEALKREQEPPAAEPTVYHQSDETADPNPEMEILTDFLLGVKDTQTCDELTNMARQVANFETEVAKKTAREAIKNHAKELGFVWSKAQNQYVSN
jgi:hypothetical protein